MAISLPNLMGAIKSQESGGNYGEVNSTSGALGAYQIMPFNLPSWGAAAGYPGITPQQFLNNPAAQDAIAGNQLQNYANTYGNVGSVAQAWYGGPGSVGKNNISGGAGYPTTGQYASQVTAKYNALGGDSGGPGGLGTLSSDPNAVSTNGDLTQYSVAGVNAPLGSDYASNATDPGGVANNVVTGPASGNAQGSASSGGSVTPSGSPGSSAAAPDSQSWTGSQVPSSASQAPPGTPTLNIVGTLPSDVSQGLGGIGTATSQGLAGIGTSISGGIASATTAGTTWLNSLFTNDSSWFTRGVLAFLAVGLILFALFAAMPRGSTLVEMAA